MVSVNNPISSSFAAQSSDLRKYIVDHFTWPSPDAGFGLFVFSQIEQMFPMSLSTGKLRVPRMKATAQAPDLAAAGFYAALQGHTGVTPLGWADAFARLSEREPFPVDRLAFPYRPFELLGIALGTQRTPNLPTAQTSWLKDVALEAKRKCVPDHWSLYMLAATSAIMGLPSPVESLESFSDMSLDELALLICLKTAGHLKGFGPWKDLEPRELQQAFLTRSLQEDPIAADVGRASVLYAAIQISANSLLQSTIEANWQVRSVTKDALELVVQICRRFPKSVQQLLIRHESRPTLTITDEYDVQDLLHALLWLHFDDVRPEEWTPSYGGVSTRMDFLLKSERVVVETKMTRPNLKQKQVVKQLIEDKEHYKTHPGCDALVAFVYDPGFYCHNAVALENDLSESSEHFSTRVVVVPRVI